MPKFALALGGFLVLLACCGLIAAYVVYYDLASEDRRDVLRILAPRLDLVAGLGILVLSLFGILFAWAYEAYVKGVLRVGEAVSTILDANPGHRIEEAGTREVKLLARNINQFAQRHEDLGRDLEARVTEARASVVEEKNRLAALMSELSQGVLVCNLEGRILLYNERARQALGAADAAENGGAALIGLGRSIFAVIDRNLLAHAVDSVRSRMAESQLDLNVQIVTATRAGALIRVQMAPVLATDLQRAHQAGGRQSEGDPPLSRYALMSISGFVLMVNNITRDFERESKRDVLLQALTEGSRAALGNIRAAVETLLDYPDCEAQQRDRFIQVISEEVSHLSGELDATMAGHADWLKTRWPLEDMLGTDVVAAARRRIESRLELPTKAEHLDDALWIKADSYALIQALTYFAGRLKDEYEVREIRFQLAREGRLAQLDLIWSGAVLSTQTLPAWEMDPLRVGGEDSPLTLRDVMERHNAEVVFIVEKARHRALFRLLLPLAMAAPVAAAAPARYGESRPEFYDFDLFRRTTHSSDLDKRALADLTYTVFDTETTGLDPSAGDEIISLAAVRIVNSRLLQHETFEQLVDPQRPPSSASVGIHGLTHEMLAGQPTIERVLPRFGEFAEDTVLVGHNAAFDMRFLQMKEGLSGVRFTQPVLDTLLLSGVIHPHQQVHSLDAIAGRLGVPVVGRHTALGDAMVTGEVFLRMIPLLAAHGILTLGEARAAAERTLYAKVQY